MGRRTSGLRCGQPRLSLSRGAARLWSRGVTVKPGTQKRREKDSGRSRAASSATLFPTLFRAFPLLDPGTPGGPSGTPGKEGKGEGGARSETRGGRDEGPRAAGPPGAPPFRRERQRRRGRAARHPAPAGSDMYHMSSVAHIKIAGV